MTKTLRAATIVAAMLAAVPLLARETGQTQDTGSVIVSLYEQGFTEIHLTREADRLLAVAYGDGVQRRIAFDLETGEVLDDSQAFFVDTERHGPRGGTPDAPGTATDGEQQR